jgi:hypothetical protein
MADKYRLVTRSDFDGLVCGALLNSLNPTLCSETAQKGAGIPATT